MEISVVHDRVLPAQPAVQLIGPVVRVGRRAARLAAILLGVAAALCLQPAGAAGVPRVSAALYDLLVSAQREAQAKHWPAVISRTNEAAADRRRTRYDQHVINEMQAVAYANLQDWPEAARHYEATLSDGFLDPAEHQRHLRTVTECFFNAGVKARPTDRSAAARYLKEAIRYGRQAIKGGAGADITTILINASYLREDYASTARLEQALVDSEVQQGMAPGAEQLDMLRSAYFKMNDRRGLLNAFKTSLTFHPTPELWAQVVGLIAAAAATQPVSTLHVYRLMLEVNILRRPVDYTEYANLALRSGLVGEARAVLEKGFADHVFPSGAQDTNRSLLNSVTAQAVMQQASLASLAEQAQAERRADVLQAAAFGYFGYRDYHTAAALLRQALVTGGLKKRNEADARLLLGIAQWRIGQPRAALDSFALVSGDPVLGPIADLWAAHVVSAAAAVRPPPPPVPARSFPMPVVTPL